MKFLLPSNFVAILYRPTQFKSLQISIYKTEHKNYIWGQTEILTRNPPEIRSERMLIYFLMKLYKEIPFNSLCNVNFIFYLEKYIYILICIQKCSFYILNNIVDVLLKKRVTIPDECQNPNWNLYESEKN